MGKFNFEVENLNGKIGNFNQKFKWEHRKMELEMGKLDSFQM